MTVRTTCLIVVGTFAGVLGWIVAWGLVFMSVWNWFLAPMGIPRLGLVQSLGVSLLFALVHNDPTKSGERDGVIMTTMMILKPAFIFCVAWILKALSS